jgi:Fur family ferric uptake transcriptional regulator
MSTKAKWRAEAAARLEAYLRERDLKMTRPRREVLEAFLGIEEHVSAEGLFDAARVLDPGIGQATVFRTVKLLADAGIARETYAPDGAKTYEHAFGHAHHDHLVCSECGAVVEFTDSAVERAQEAVYRRHGFVPVSHTMELVGVCPSCARKAASPGL